MTTKILAIYVLTIIIPVVSCEKDINNTKVNTVTLSDFETGTGIDTNAGPSKPFTNKIIRIFQNKDRKELSKYLKETVVFTYIEYDDMSFTKNNQQFEDSLLANILFEDTYFFQKYEEKICFATAFSNAAKDVEDYYDLRKNAELSLSEIRVFYEGNYYIIQMDCTTINDCKIYRFEYNY
ncbi:MAG: hypothetical protein ABUK01_17875 [Leptospirales bacterium]